jgi:predicted transposase/invertase (TIGR01784 family)
MKFANPKTDFTFKRLFGNEHRKNLTINFLNNLLERKSDNLIIEIRFCDNANIPTAETEKVTYLDISCTDQSGTDFIIEMQVAKEASFLQRSQYYASFALSNQLKKGDLYNKLQPVIFIGIMNNPLFANEKQVISHHLICDINSGQQSLRHLEFHYIELSKFHKKITELETEMDKWLFFFKNADSLETIPQQFVGSKEFKEAFHVLEQSLWTPAEIKAYQKSLDVLNRDFRLQEGIFDEGLKKGAQQEKEAMVMKLLKKGIEISEIVDITELSFEYVEELLKKNKHKI